MLFYRIFLTYFLILYKKVDPRETAIICVEVFYRSDLSGEKIAVHKITIAIKVQ